MRVLALLLVASVCCAQGDGVLLGAGFDGSDDAVLNLGVPETNTPFVTMNGPFVEGVKGQARVLGGKNKCTYFVNEGFFPREGSCSMWVKPEDWRPVLSENFVFFASFTCTDIEREYVRLIIYKYCQPKDLTVLVQNTAAGPTATRIQVPIGLWEEGQWHHIVVTWDEKLYRLYVDGEALGESPAVELPAEGRWEIALGTPYAGWAYIGKERTAIDEFKVLGRVMSAEEIRKEYAAMSKDLPKPEKVEPEAAADTGQIEGNIALEQDGALVLASSFADYESLYPDNLIDGDDRTSWKPYDAVLPVWLEVRWDVPMRVDGVVLNQKTVGSISAFSVMGWEDDAWKPLSEVDGAGAADSLALRASFEETTTDRVRVLIREGKGDQLELTTLAVTGPEQPIIARLEPYWHSSYIWYPEPDKTHKGNAPRYFRKTFDIGDRDALRSGAIQLRSNDYYRVFINGTQAATGATDIRPIDVTPSLREGRNVISVITDLKYNPGRWGWGELIFELSLNYDTHSEFIISDATTKAFDAEIDGWLKPEFDDSAWPQAEQFLKPPEGVWGKIAYKSSTVNERVTLTGCSITPDSPRPGETATVQVRLKPDAALRDDYVFLLEVGEEPEFAEWEDLSVAKMLLVPDKPTSQWQAGEETVLSFSLHLPNYSPDGLSPVKLTAFSTRQGAGLDFLDSSGAKLEEFTQIDIDRYQNEPAAGPGTCKLEFNSGAGWFNFGGTSSPPMAFAYTLPSYGRYHDYKQTGVHLYHLKTSPLPWDDSPETFERACRVLDRRAQAALSVDPDALFMVHTELRPSSEWLKAHPDERLVTVNGELGPISFSSRYFNESALQFIRDLTGYLKSRPYYDRIVAWLPMGFGAPDSTMGGTDGNLFQTDRSKLTLGDHNPQAIREFQEWLRVRYNGSVEALRDAWKDPEITFETAKPVVSELITEGADGGVFRDPLGSAMTFDYAEWLSGVMGRFYTRVMHVIKQEAGKPVLVGAYYGYNVAHMRGYNSPGAWFQNNNFDLPELLDNPDWDFFAAPTPYSNRRAGTSYFTSFTHDSLRLHNRMLMGEIDHRTFIAGPTTYGRMRTDRETDGILKRDMIGAIIDGAGYWFSDWSRSQGREGVGFFMDPGILETISRTREIHKQALKQEKKSTSQIAVVTTGRSMAYHDLYRASPIYDNLILYTLWDEMGKIGAPYDIFTIEDLGHETVQRDYKLYVFLNTFYLTPEDRQRIDALKRDGKTLLFLYAPGYVSRETGLKTENISQLTGIDVIKRADRERMQYQIADVEHPIAAELDKQKVYKTHEFSYALSRELHPPDFGPVFAVEDETAAVLATYPDGAAAMAIKGLEGWQSVYCAVPLMTSEVFRAIARHAGVHIYCDETTVLKVDNRLLMLHTGDGNARTINVKLPAARTVVDAYSDEVIAEDASEFTVPLDRMETRAFWLQ